MERSAGLSKILTFSRGMLFSKPQISWSLKRSPLFLNVARNRGTLIGRHSWLAPPSQGIGYHINSDGNRHQKKANPKPPQPGG
ncbi:MAG: hypothetical protein DLM68_11375 [Hyphomicrobiales bacterium]|nr:MAG: hypothetical protein DLM68_11375 [Hyphomicrobiales bacterium]